MNIFNQLKLIFNLDIKDQRQNQILVLNSRTTAPSTDDLFWMLLGLGVGQDHQIEHHHNVHNDQTFHHSESDDFEY